MKTQTLDELMKKLDAMLLDWHTEREAQAEADAAYDRYRRAMSRRLQGGEELLKLMEEAQKNGTL